MSVDIIKYYNTLRYLKPVQLRYQIFYRMRKAFRRILGVRPNYTRYKQGHVLQPTVTWIEKPVSYIGAGVFRFLNVESRFGGSWDARTNGDLWRYNLNYMDFLLQPAMTAEEGFAWIERFIEEMPANGIATDPYPISLRGMNWIKFVSLHNGKLSLEQLRQLDTALYSQYCILAHSTEKHLMANHYLENGFSLLFAAEYFKDDALYKCAEKVIVSQLEEQVLPDGAHFELSPMYHCIILERLLDCYSIVNDKRHKALSSLMLEKATLMLGWLETAVMSDGNIPLLNDSALDIAPSPAELFIYAKKLGIEWSAVPLGASGYRKFNGDGYDAFVDVAALGPSYNLGHSHADTFTFVMNVAGKPFIVDTGVSTYSAGERRDYERSTRAHNTVTVNGIDSSRVWGAFRCAERAKVVIDDETNNYVKASHNGYRSMGVTVSRGFVADENEFTVHDEICSNDTECIASFHLAPGVEIISVTDSKAVTSLGTLRFCGASAIVVEPVEVSFTYNRLQQAVRLSVSFKKKLSTVIVPKTI